jgi:alpha-glucosidase
MKDDYDGPATYSDAGNVVETSDIRVEVDPASLSCRFRDKTRQGMLLTTIHLVDLDRPWKGMDLEPGAIQNIYGLGQKFVRLGSSEGDWISHGVREGKDHLGNGFEGFHGGMVGNVQIPVMYAVGANGLNYGLFFDNVYKQRWDFERSWWQVRSYGDHIRFYLMTGPDLADLRADYLELTGRPPVPPRKAFGMWVSEFGYDNWGQVDSLLRGLRREHFPVDGFVLDLNWFGGVKPGSPDASRMGKLDWDQEDADGNSYFFPEPGANIRRLAADHVGLAVIEESYLARTAFNPTYDAMPGEMCAFRSSNDQCDCNRPQVPLDTISGFWGSGRMIDWSDRQASEWVHENRRFPNLVRKGGAVHWTDLGEPESFDASACYEGVETTPYGRKNRHPDIHNLYNLLWNRSIWDGYVSKRGTINDLGEKSLRPLILTRSGAAGIQRFGTAMWSGDIASNLDSLATHANAQLHMSFSGIDYYGADTGGFRRESLPQNDNAGTYRGFEQEMYTQWFANACWFDVPLRPHTDNEFVVVSPPYQTAPHLVGSKESNLANLRQRYELIPYYYSLAYEAWLRGRPLVPPLVFYYQNDPHVRRMGHEKLIGRDLLVAIVARHGEYQRDVYLPAGTWINYHTREWHSSNGQSISQVPVYRNGLFRLPVFARAGAILPLMHVDQETKDAFGHRTDSLPPRNDLIVKVFPDRHQTSFILYEDDGRTLAYTDGGRPLYRYRTTEIRQIQPDQGNVFVTIEPAKNKGLDEQVPYSFSASIAEPSLPRLACRVVMSRVLSASVKNP